MSVPKRIHANILDLNGNPAQPHHHPLLFRTASGYLFQPEGTTVRSAEIPAAQSARPLVMKPVSAVRLQHTLPKAAPSLEEGIKTDAQLGTSIRLQASPAKQAEVVTPDPRTEVDPIAHAMWRRSYAAQLESASSESLRSHAASQLSSHVPSENTTSDSKDDDASSRSEFPPPEVERRKVGKTVRPSSDDIWMQLGRE